MELSNLEIEIEPNLTMMKRINGNLYLSLEQVEILEKYKVDYKRFSNLSDLIFELESIEEETDDIILSNLLDVLAERDYYENFEK